MMHDKTIIITETRTTEDISTMMTDNTTIIEISTTYDTSMIENIHAIKIIKACCDK